MTTDWTTTPGTTGAEPGGGSFGRVSPDSSDSGTGSGPRDQGVDHVARHRLAHVALPVPVRPQHPQLDLAGVLRVELNVRTVLTFAYLFHTLE